MVVVVLAGCGASRATTSDTSTSKAVRALRTDLRSADDAQLRADDFPAGWKPRRQTSLTRGRCGIRTAADAAVAQSQSLNFTRGNASAESTVYVYSTEATATHWFDKLTSRAARECLPGGIKAAQQAAFRGLRYRKVGTAPMPMAPLGKQRAADQFIFLVTNQKNGRGAVTPIDLEFVRVDRGLEILLFADVLNPFPEDIAGHVAKRVTARLAAGLAG